MAGKYWGTFLLTNSHSRMSPNLKKHENNTNNSQEQALPRIFKIPVSLFGNCKQCSRYVCFHVLYSEIPNKAIICVSIIFQHIKCLKRFMVHSILDAGWNTQINEFKNVVSEFHAMFFFLMSTNTYQKTSHK